MSPERATLFCSRELAQRIERVEARLMAEASEAARSRAVHGQGFAIPIGGGVATFAGEGSPFNKVAGLGFDGVPSAAAFEEIERAFAARGTATQIELAHIGDPSIAIVLTERGYRLESFENVLGRSLVTDIERVTPSGIEVRRSGDDELEPWLDVVCDGVAHPDTQGLPSHEAFSREVVARSLRDLALVANVRRYVALRGGVFAGGGSLGIGEGVAQLMGAATVPPHRRRGIQTALLSARLADAAAEGCDVAVITTQPGSKSQQNAQLRGFALLYTRAVLIKQLRPPVSGDRRAS